MKHSLLELAVKIQNRSLGLLHLKEYGRGETFFQTLPPSFYIFRVDSPSLIHNYVLDLPPSLRIFMVFASIINIEIPCKTPLPHFMFFDWTPPPSLHNYRLDPPSLLAFLKKSSTPPCILLNAIALGTA